MSLYTTVKNEPSSHYAAVTASDTVNFTVNGRDRYCRGVYVGGAGNVVAVRPDDTTVTFSSVPAGSILPIVCKRINSTSTTATNMVALF